MRRCDDCGRSGWLGRRWRRNRCRRLDELHRHHLSVLPVEPGVGWRCEVAVVDEIGRKNLEKRPRRPASSSASRCAARRPAAGTSGTRATPGQGPAAPGRRAGVAGAALQLGVGRGGRSGRTPGGSTAGGFDDAAAKGNQPAAGRFRMNTPERDPPTGCCRYMCSTRRARLRRGPQRRSAPSAITSGRLASSPRRARGRHAPSPPRPLNSSGSAHGHA